MIYKNMNIDIHVYPNKLVNTLFGSKKHTLVSEHTISTFYVCASVINHKRIKQIQKKQEQTHKPKYMSKTENIVQ